MISRRSANGNIFPLSNYSSLQSLQSLLILALTVAGINAGYSQVVMRDTVIQWQHFDYTLNESYGLATHSSTEVVPRSFDGIVLENELVKICLIPEFGARVISFIYKPTGHEQLYQNPVGTPYSISTDIFYHNWLMVYGGIFPTFPEPEHGKYWNYPWNEEVLVNTENKVTISMWLKDDLNNPLHPGQYNNGTTGITCYFNVSLESGKPYFTVDVELENDETADNFEYWTCITFAPGSEIGNTFSPSNSEMIVPIDQYQVGWNPGNWMNTLDDPTRSSGPRVQVFDKLAHLSNWENSGIAYAYPTLTADYYGVINQDNAEGLFRLSSDQSQTPGMKFWTWGDQQGLAADPYDFSNPARPYIELWSGVSQEFFEDAPLGANASIAWTETYFPTIGLSTVQYLSEEIAIGAYISDDALTVESFLPASSEAYSLEIIVIDTEVVLLSEEVTIAVQSGSNTEHTFDLSELEISEVSAEVQVTLLRNGQEMHSETIPYANPTPLDIPEVFDPGVYVANKEIHLTFDTVERREVTVYDMYGRTLNRTQTVGAQADIPYIHTGIYVLKVTEQGRSWTKRILIK